MMSHMSQSVIGMCPMLHVVTVTPSCDTEKIVESSGINNIIWYISQTSFSLYLHSQ